MSTNATSGVVTSANPVLRAAPGPRFVAWRSVATSRGGVDPSSTTIVCVGDPSGHVVEGGHDDGDVGGGEWARIWQRMQRARVDRSGRADVVATGVGALAVSVSNSPMNCLPLVGQSKDTQRRPSDDGVAIVGPPPRRVEPETQGFTPTIRRRPRRGRCSDGSAAIDRASRSPYVGRRARRSG